MNNVSYSSSAKQSFNVIETKSETPFSPSIPLHTTQPSSCTSNTPSTGRIPTTPPRHGHITKQSRQPSKLDRIFTCIKSLPHQNPSFPSSPIEPPTPEYIPKTRIKHEHLSHQTPVLHSIAQYSIHYNHPLTNVFTQLPPTYKTPQPKEMLQQNELLCPQPLTQTGSEEPSSHNFQDSFVSQPSNHRAEQYTLVRRLADALRRRDVKRDKNNTLIMHKNADDEILELTEYNNHHNRRSQSSPSYKILSDSSSTALLENFEHSRLHGTLSSSSSDFDQAQRDETYTAVPQLLKRTYTSSEDSYRRLEIETLSSATIDEASVTTYSTTEDSPVTTNTSTLYTITEDSHTAYELSVTIPELDDTAYEAVSVSSEDADLAWREEFIKPLPPIIGRTYSSSTSESCEIFDEGLMNSLGEVATVNSGQTVWTSEDASEILSNQGPSRSQRGYIQSDPNWLEESKQERQSNSIEATESMRKLRTSSQTRTNANNIDRPSGKSKKPYILRKAARLLSRIFSSRSTRSPDDRRSETRTRRKSFSSLFWGK